jgi:hypothetical protein
MAASFQAFRALRSGTGHMRFPGENMATLELFLLKGNQNWNV